MVVNVHEMSSFENLVRKRLGEFDAKGDEDEKIEYLLKTAPFLKEYSDVASSIADPMSPDSSVKDACKTIEDYVQITDGDHSKKRDILVRYLEEVERIPVNIKKADSFVDAACDECGERVVIHQEESSVVCISCGVSKQFMECGMRGISYDEEVSRDMKSQFSYKRLTHLNQWIDALQAKENTTIPDDVIEAVRNEFKKHRLTSKSDVTPERVKMFLKKLNLSRWYEHKHHIVSAINGAPAIRLPQDLEERLKTMFLQIQHPFEKHRPPNRKNFLHYGYTLYKLCQLLGEDKYLPLFPLLKSAEKLRAQDELWKKICEELKWEYISTI